MQQCTQQISVRKVLLRCQKISEKTVISVPDKPSHRFNENAADVKMKIPVLVRSLKSSILSSTSGKKTFWGVVSAAVEQSRRKANMVAQGDRKFGP